jgi:hypothetical protein
MALELNGTTGVSLVQDGVVATADLADSAITTAKLADTSITTAKLDSDVNSGVAKAWVNFNGSTDVILSSFNVTSLTNVGTGRHTINFTTAFNDTNYCVVTGNNDYGADSGLRTTGVDNHIAKTTSNVSISTKYASGATTGTLIDYNVQNGVVVFN